MLVRQGPSIAVVDDDIPGQHKHLLSRFMVSVGFYPIHLLYFSLLPILFSVPLAIMHIPFIDALFLGTSAVCSNGLTTYTFPNRAAEVILFFAIQCGGVCFVSLFSVLLRLAFIRANFCQPVRIVSETSPGLAFSRIPHRAPTPVLMKAPTPSPTIHFKRGPFLVPTASPVTEDVKEVPLFIFSLQYQSMKLVLMCVLSYAVFCTLAGTLAVAGSIAVHPHSRDVVWRSGNSLWWFSVFHVISSFHNTGMALLPDGVASLASNIPLLIVLALLIMAGNTFFPIFLRGWVHLYTYLFPPSRQVTEFLLHNPRQCYTHLFLRTDTIVLACIQLGITLLQFVVVGTLEFSHPSLAVFHPFNRLAIILFDSVSTRSAGLASFSFAQANRGVTASLILFMLVTLHGTTVPHVKADDTWSSLLFSAAHAANHSVGAPPTTTDLASPPSLVSEDASAGPATQAASNAPTASPLLLLRRHSTTMVPHFFLASLEQPDRVRETPAALLTPRPRLSFPDTGRLQLMRQFMPPSSPEAITRQRHALTQPQLGNKHPVEPQQHTQRVLELRADASNNHTTAVSSLLMPPPHRRRRAFLRALGKVFRAQQDAPFLRDAIYMCLAFFVLCTMMSEALLQRTLPGGTMALLFEITSAFGTVGYSMGNGHDLAFSALFPPGGKAVIIILMLLGRLRGLPLSIDQTISAASFAGAPEAVLRLLSWDELKLVGPSMRQARPRLPEWHRRRAHSTSVMRIQKNARNVVIASPRRIEDGRAAAPELQPLLQPPSP